MTATTIAYTRLTGAELRAFAEAGDAFATAELGRRQANAQAKADATGKAIPRAKLRSWGYAVTEPVVIEAKAAPAPKPAAPKAKPAAPKKAEVKPAAPLRTGRDSLAKVRTDMDNRFAEVNGKLDGIAMSIARLAVRGVATPKV